MNRLKDLRIANRLSITDLYNATNISRSTLNSIENGKRRMNINHAQILSKYVGVSLDYILGTDKDSVVNTFKEQLEEVFTYFYDEIITESLNGTLDEKTKHIFDLLDRFLHDDNILVEDLSAVKSMLDMLKNARNGSLKK